MVLLTKKSFQTSRRSFKKPSYKKVYPARPKPFRTGTVAIRSTDIARDGAPFPAKKTVNFQYDSTIKSVTSGGLSLQLPIACNGLFDVDQTTAGSFDNKQPLYFDTLLTSSLYQTYKVTSWDVTFTVINVATVPLEIFAVSAYFNLTGWDTPSEVANLPGVRKYVLTPAGGSMDKVIIRIRGTPSDVFPIFKDDFVLTGGITYNPTNAIYGGLLLNALSGTVNAVVNMAGNFRTICSAQAAIVS